MDLISRQAAIDLIESIETERLKGNVGLIYAPAIKGLQALPSAQPEIIRCKDCKWYKTNYSWNGKEHKVCVIEPYEPIREDDDFCSRAERKE